MATNIIDELRWRGLVYDRTEGVEELVSKQPVTVYNGFDPTADSLHIGNLVPMMQLARWQRFGHTPIALAGGGTGMIGDPSGRSSERSLLSWTEVEANVASIKAQLASILDFEVKRNPARIVNNVDWLAPLSMLDFLRDVGKHFTVNYMMAKDSVKSRLDREDGISYTEFSYMLLQAYDFLHLFDTADVAACNWAAATSGATSSPGTELIRKARGGKAHGLVYPLLTRADGSKFGKTAEGTSVWLSPERTSPYRFYQYWYNTDDSDVITYLKYFTWLDESAIAELAAKVAAEPEKREAQRVLAQEVTRMVHGETAVDQGRAGGRSVVRWRHRRAGSGRYRRHLCRCAVQRREPETNYPAMGLSIVDLLVATGLASSKADARRSIEGGGMYLNNERIDDQGPSK